MSIALIDCFRQIEVHYEPTYHEACATYGIKRGCEIAGMNYNKHHMYPKCTLLNDNGSAPMNNKLFDYEFKTTITVYCEDGSIEEVFDGWCRQQEVRCIRTCSLAHGCSTMLPIACHSLHGLAGALHN